MPVAIPVSVDYIIDERRMHSMNCFLYLKLSWQMGPWLEFIGAVYPVQNPPPQLGVFERSSCNYGSYVMH